jgi:hypothetical protein
MLLFFHSTIQEDQARALEQIKISLKLQKNRFVPGSSTDLDANIAKAFKREHPDKNWLRLIVRVFLSKIDISALDKWKKWFNLNINPAHIIQQQF